LDRPMNTSASSSIGAAADAPTAAGFWPGSTTGDQQNQQRVNEPLAPQDGRFFVPAATTGKHLSATKNGSEGRSAPASPAACKRKQTSRRRESLTDAHYTNFGQNEIQCATGAGKNKTKSPPLDSPNRLAAVARVRSALAPGAGKVRRAAATPATVFAPGSSPAPLPLGRGAAMRAHDAPREVKAGRAGGRPV
jgi:hypothetical protein